MVGNVGWGGGVGEGGVSEGIGGEAGMVWGREE